VAAAYRHRLGEFDWIEPLECLPDRTHAYHLFVTRLLGRAAVRQKDIFNDLRARGVGAHVMYRPVYQHSFYKERFPDRASSCPRAEAGYASLLMLPIFAGLTEEQMDFVVVALRNCQESILSRS
jgi:perosamine synthetase